MNYSVMLDEVGRHNEALPIHKKLIKINPTKSTYHSNLANCYYSLERHE